MKKHMAALALFAVTGLVAVAAQAEVISNAKVPANISVFVPCANGGAGENVDLSGDLHVLLTLTVNGNNFSGKTHFQPQGISGVGAVTGAKYQATGVTQDKFGGSFNNGVAVLNFVNNFRIVGQGPGNNFVVHQNAHITINANGIQTATVDNQSIECK